MKKLILLSVITLSLFSCSSDDKEDLFCGTVVVAGHVGSHDEITILRGNERKIFIVDDANKYPLHSYQCK